ncbi:hypothetical protein [Halomicrobium salinisoli]|uniref:hypothetical protein n=1 Tax=Halomicrobium salinisoli TaxID=2878391 RepID=UPI001CF0A848|nr:hypothetical protein [Halomicrobium salinisoli]
MPAEIAQVSVEPVTEVPETASVCHVDELAPPLGETVAAADGEDGSTVTVDPYRAALIDQCGCDVVKATEYYRVDRV